MFGKKRAIKKYFSILPRELRKRYGGSPPWTSGQVTTTVKELGLSQTYISYAVLVFCGEQAFIESGGSKEVSLDIAAYLTKNGFGSGAAIGGGNSGDWLFDSSDGTAYGEAGGFGGDGGGGGGE